jgi:hypothetical protein
MIQQHTRTNYTVTQDCDYGVRSWVLILSDVHFDSKHCDRALLTQHLEQARVRGARVFLNGDFLDCMGGKYDPRNTLPGGLRPEYRGQDYFDLVIQDAARFLEPYKDLLTIYAQGNHETNVRKRQHTDPSKRGHDHNKWHVPITVQRVNNHMKVEQRTVHHIRCGSYKELSDGFGGWEIEKGFAQPRLGGWWWWCERGDRRRWRTGVEEAT